MNGGLFITMIAAVSADGFIATDGRIPWKLPYDVEQFRALAAGQWLLLGRKTFDEMRGWFRNHHPLILTRQKLAPPPLGQFVASVDEAIRAANQAGAGELLVCGGGEIYAAAMPWADRLILTIVDITLVQGTPFPNWTTGQWQKVTHQNLPADDTHSHPFSITEWLRP